MAGKVDFFFLFFFLLLLLLLLLDLCYSCISLKAKKVPKRGVEDLPTNYFTASAVSAASASATIDPNNDVKCELCEENEATVRCKQCDQFFCDTCQKIHQKLKVSAHHQYVTIDEALKKGSSSSASRILHCQKHPHQEVNAYCKTDQTAVCPQCAIEDHRGHDLDLLVNISKEFKDTISTLVTKVRFEFVSKVLR